jgi:glycosyltransferase involved in cell wall biosynthesis
MTGTDRAPISAIVTSCNEAALLPRALAGIAFCDEVIVVEVCSDGDDTAAVAERFGARFIRHPHVRIAEAARVTVAPEAKHDLLLVIDPDEEVPKALASEIVELAKRLPSDVAAVDAPLQYYFGDKKLRGTVWGGPNRRRMLVRRTAVELTPTIWGGMRLHDGYRVLVLPFSDESAIIHHWSSGWRDLVEKHRRYLGQEAADRAAAGHVTGWRKVVETPFGSFRESFFAKLGYRDGFLGLGLSLFWAAFRTASEIRLLRRLRAGRRE